jgi:hypothetical protein
MLFCYDSLLYSLSLRRGQIRQESNRRIECVGYVEVVTMLLPAKFEVFGVSIWPYCRDDSAIVICDREGDYFGVVETPDLMGATLGLLKTGLCFCPLLCVCPLFLATQVSRAPATIDQPLTSHGLIHHRKQRQRYTRDRSQVG